MYKMIAVIDDKTCEICKSVDKTQHSRPFELLWMIRKCRNIKSEVGCRCKVEKL